jgi:hypothetical protein
MALKDVLLASRDGRVTKSVVLLDEVSVNTPFASNPAITDEVDISTCATISIIVIPSISSGGKIRLQVEFGDGAGYWGAEDNRDPTGHLPQTHDFATSNPIVLDFKYNSSSRMRVKYGYVTSGALTLTLVVQGRW